jgi:hypothetical protein
MPLTHPIDRYRSRTGTAQRDGLRYRRRNFLATHVAREGVFNVKLALARLLKLPHIRTELRATLIRADGARIDLGVLGRKIVTTAGVNYLAATHINTGEPENINFHDSGTGTTAAAIGDTALQTATGNARVAGTQSNPSANIYRSVATLSYTTGAAITEWGIFTASSVGTLFDHFVFSAINVLNGDSIAFTFNETFSAGG